MVPVIVTQKDGNRPGLRTKRLAETDDARPGIENEDGAGALVPDLDARCVAPVSD